VIHHLRGLLHELTPASAVVETNGVGFELRIPLSTFERIRGSRDVFLLTHFHVREEEMRLYAFATEGERQLFRLLLSVSGVGPTIALQALCALSPGQVARSIAEGDLKTIQKIKGVGKKLAERMVLELRDRVDVVFAALGLEGAERTNPDPVRDLRTATLAQPDVADAVLGLVSLGFDRKSAENRVLDVLQREEFEGRSAGAAELIKVSLRSG
jgi:Holliday junction DNA helicase RuvA